METEERSRTDGCGGAAMTGTCGMSIEQRTMRSLETIEFYLSELVYYSWADHRVGSTPEKRSDYARYLAGQLEDYKGFQAMRTDLGSGRD